MRIAINGAGVAGPTLAYWLRRFGHEPVLFERAAAPRTGGYIVDFWGLGYDLAERMEVLPGLNERAYSMQRLKFVDAQGVELASLDLKPIRRQLADRFISISRADLASALLAACEGVVTHFDRSIVGLREGNQGVIATLSDGEQERFDLVVGADGLHSRVRSLVFGAPALVETPLGCHVAAARLRGYPHRDELTYVSHTVPKRHVSRVALRDDETLVLFIWRSELTPGDLARSDPDAMLRYVFGEVGWEVPQLLERVKNVEDVYVDGVSQVHLEHWSRGRVALLGDAAACASLLAGEGTGLAMVEAYVLAGEIHRAGSDLSVALEAYERRLRAFVRAKQRAAVRLRAFFAPETFWGLWARDVAVSSLSVPFLAKHVLARSLRDDLRLPRYEAD